MQTVVETPPYLSHAEQAGLVDDDRRKIVDFLSANPEAGDLMVGTGGARKAASLVAAREKVAGIA